MLNYADILCCQEKARLSLEYAELANNQNDRTEFLQIAERFYEAGNCLVEAFELRARATRPSKSRQTAKIAQALREELNQIKTQISAIQLRKVFFN